MERKDSRRRTLRIGESQRKDGKYQYRYTDPLTRKVITIYSWRLVESDKTPAGKKFDKSLRAKEGEIAEMISRHGSGYAIDRTLNQMFDIYIKRKRYKGKKLADTTKNNYTSMYNNHIRNSTIGDNKLVDIRKADIVSLYENMEQKGLSSGTITFFNKLLSSVFNMAIDEGIIDRNPTQRALNSIEQNNNYRDALTIEEENKLVEYARNNDYGMYKKIRFILDTMCRVSEMCGVTWDDINMEDRIITIDHQLIRYQKEGEAKASLHIEPTKGRELRIIPMTDEVYEILKKIKPYKIAYPDYIVEGKHDFVFRAKELSKPLTKGVFEAELKTLINKYNSDNEEQLPNVTPHILRHTGCTRYAEDRMDAKVLQYLMGHKSFKTVNDIYNHVDAQRAKNEIIYLAKKKMGN